MPQLSDDKLQMLVLGQYAGLGQQRSSGLGRYRLSSPSGESYAPQCYAAEPLLLHAFNHANLIAAVKAVTAQNRHLDYINTPAIPTTALDGYIEQIRASLFQGDYKVGPLEGHVFYSSAGSLKAVTQPPFWDRVLQQVVTQVAAPALEQYYSPSGYGFHFKGFKHKSGIRRGRGSAQVTNFDDVCWQSLIQQLSALYRFDPVVNLLMDWVSAPLQYQGDLIERTQGLPQGSPISPMLAKVSLQA